MKLSKKQLELIERIELGHNGDADYYCDERRLYLAAKQKLRELLMRRFEGSDEAFSWKRGDKYYVLFSSPQRGEKADSAVGWEVDGMWAACEDVNQITLVDELTTEQILQVLFQFTGLFDTGMACTVQGRDTLTPAEYRNEVRREIRDFLMQYYDSSYFDDEVSQEDRDADKAIYGDMVSGDIESLTDLVLALDRAADGFIEEALSVDVFAELVRTVNENMGSLYDDRYIVENLNLFMTPYGWSSPDNEISVTAIQSEEIYWYNKYKDNVPDEVRDVIDTAIRIYDNPLPAAETIVEDFDRNCLHIVTIMLEGGWGMSLEDINPLWKDVRDFLIETLPGLREEYLVSGSLKESRTNVIKLRPDSQAAA